MVPFKMASIYIAFLVIFTTRVRTPPDSNAPTICLTTPYFKTNMPMGTKMVVNIFVTDSVLKLGVKITTTSVGNEE